jgi:type I restriction enzyme S subunit
MRGSHASEYASLTDRNSVVVQEAETIIICDGSNSGEIFTGFRGVLSSTMGKIEKKAEIDDGYLRAFLGSTFDIFNGSKTGAAIPHLDKDAFYRIILPLPPLPEQKRIVTILDEAFAGIAVATANAEKNLANARELFEGYLAVAFANANELAPLSDLCSDITDGDHAPPPKAERGVPFITISDIVKHTRIIDFHSTFSVPQEYFSKLKPNKKPRRGDVLYTVTGATLGIPVLVREDREFCF